MRSDTHNVTPRSSLSVLDGTAIMVGVVVGIGIFRTPPLIAMNVDSEFAFMAVWLAGGLVTLIGALCYAELAAAHPSAGGEYHFLSRGLGRPVAVLFGWARGTVIQTGAIVAVAFVIGDYASAIVPLGAHGPAVYAALSVAGLTALNAWGTLQSSRAQLGFTLLTVVALLAIAKAGILVGAEAPAPAPGPEPSGLSPALGMAMILVLLTFGGWNEAAYLSAEVRHPQRSMVRVLLLGTLVLVCLYGLVNYAYLSVLGLDGMRASDAVASDLMRLVAGEWGAILLSLIVVVAALSTLNATIFTGARVYYALGRDIPALARLGAWNDRGQNPANGILLQGLIALALVAFGAATPDGFQAMVDYTAPVFWFFLLLVGVSLFVLRRREPHRPLPFRVPLYPLTPLLFCATCVYMLYSSLAYTGVGALIGIAVMLAGAPLLMFRRRTAPAPAPAE